MTLSIPEPLARVLARIPVELAHDVAHVIEQALSSDDPKAALARAAQVLAHEKGADAAVDALFDAKRRVGTGE